MKEVPEDYALELSIFVASKLGRIPRVVYWFNQYLSMYVIEELEDKLVNGGRHTVEIKALNIVLGAGGGGSIILLFLHSFERVLNQFII